MGIAAPKRYAVKPPTAVGEQKNHSIANALIALFPFTEGGGAPLYLPAGAAGTLSGTTPPTWLTGYGGPALNFAGGGIGTSLVSFGTDPLLQDLVLDGNQVSWFWRFQMTGVTGGLACRSNGSTNGWNIGIGNGGGWTLSFPRSTGSRFLASGSTGIIGAGNTWWNLVVTYDGNNSTTSCTAYVNGLVDPGVSSTAGGGVTLTDSASNFEIGQIRNGSGEANFDMGGNMSLMAVWKRILSPAEALEVTFDENLLFSSIRETRIALLAGISAQQGYNWLIT